MGPAFSSATLNWDTFCDLLSGAPPDSLIQQRAASDDSEGMQEGSNAEDVLAQLAGEFLFDSDPPRRTLERFWLKLNLFGMLCQSVLQAHDSTHRPILALDPTRVQVRGNSRRDSWLPGWWRFDVSVVPSPMSPSDRLDEIPHGMACELVPVPDDVDRIYVPRAVQEWPLGLEVMATALVQSVDPIPNDSEGEMQALVRIHLATEKLPAREFTTYDVFKVSLPVRGSSRLVHVWARKTDSPERGVIVSGATDTVSNDVGKLLLKLDQQVLPDTRVGLFRAFALSSDLDSLGLLLLRSLLAPDARQFPDAAKHVQALLSRIGPVVEGMDPEDAYTLHTRMRERFLEIGPILRNPGIPDELWIDGLILVARCLSTVSGFGFRGNAGEGMGQERDSPVGLVLRDLAHLAARARVEMFEPEQRGDTIQRVCEQVLAEIDQS